MMNDDGYVASCVFCYLAPYLPYYAFLCGIFSFFFMVVVGCVVAMPEKARDGIFRGGLHRGFGSSYQVITRTA